MEEREPPEMVRVLLESVARTLEADHGRWVIEIVLQNGRIEKLWRHEGPLLRRDLDERFGPELA